MPGIAGVISKSEMRSRDVEQMTATMRTESFYVSHAYENAKLNVSVAWTAHSKAPFDGAMMWNNQHDIGLIFSGEDFMDRSLVMQLTGRTAVEPGPKRLLALYEALGANFVGKLNGCFAGLIIDLRRRLVLLFNDRYGLGRIYWTENAEGVYFASEAKALLAVLPSTRRFDTRAVAETISCGSVMQDRTLFAGISLMPPASIWRSDAGVRLVRQRYFEPSEWEQQTLLEPEEFYQQLKETFPRVLSRYVDAPSIAMSLTGGLDGRMIMAAAHAAPGALPCYTFNGPYSECADLRIARDIAHLCRQPHRVISVGQNFLSQFSALAEKSVYISDGTMDITGAVELYVNKIAREIAPIRLTGNYGSEIVRGNVAFRTSRYDPSLFVPELAEFLSEADTTYRAERNCAWTSFIAFKQTPWHHYARLSVEQSQLIMRTPFLDNELVSLVYRAPPDSLESPTNVLRLIAECDPRFDEVPSDRGLRLNERYWDHVMRRVIDFSIKAEYAYDYGMPNWLARIDRLLAPIQPEKLFLGRHKFYHFRIWYKEKLGDYLKETLLQKDALERGYFRPEAIERMVREHTTGAANWTRELHRALTIELTHQQLIDRW